MTVAAAIPKKPNTINKKMLKNVFTITVIIEKFNGSLEFSFAKKIGVRIFTKIKAIRPKEKTFRAIEELYVEIASNAPLSNKKEIIKKSNIK